LGSNGGRGRNSGGRTSTKQFPAQHGVVGDRVAVLTGEAAVELLESVPADGALDLLKAVALKHQAAQGLAVEGIGGLKLPEGEGSLGGR